MSPPGLKRKANVALGDYSLFSLFNLNIKSDLVIENSNYRLMQL